MLLNIVMSQYNNISFFNTKKNTNDKKLYISMLKMFKIVTLSILFIKNTSNE